MDINKQSRDALASLHHGIGTLDSMLDLATAHVTSSPIEVTAESTLSPSSPGEQEMNAPWLPPVSISGEPIIFSLANKPQFLPGTRKFTTHLFGRLGEMDQAARKHDFGELSGLTHGFKGAGGAGCGYRACRTAGNRGKRRGNRGCQYPIVKSCASWRNVLLCRRARLQALSRLHRLTRQTSAQCTGITGFNQWARFYNKGCKR